MPETPSTKTSALDKVNARRVMRAIKARLSYAADFSAVLAKAFEGKPNDDFTRKAITGYKVGPLRRQLWRDIYKDPESRRVAVTVHRRARKTKNACAGWKASTSAKRNSPNSVTFSTGNCGASTTG
jgi:hypothetical protein